MSEALIRMHQLGKRYGSAAPDSLWAVRGATLSVFAAEITVLMGPSGSGKTTLLTMIGGLLEATEGQLSVCGMTLDGSTESERQRFRRENIGFIFQNYNLLETLTAAENVGMGLFLRGRPMESVTEYLEAVGMETKADSCPCELSGGQRQRVAIARALAGDPPVILADEPTAALDAAQGKIVMDLLRRRAKDKGVAVVIVTHDQRVRQFADRVIEMEDGRLRRVVRRHWVPRAVSAKGELICAKV